MFADKKSIGIFNSKVVLNRGRLKLRSTHRQRETERDRERDRERQRETGRERQRERQRETERDRERQRDRERELLQMILFTTSPRPTPVHSAKSPSTKIFWSKFYRIWTEYGESPRKSQYSLQIRENTDQKKLRI